MSATIAAVAARSGAALLALIVAGCTPATDPPPSIPAPATTAPDRSTGADPGTSDDDEAARLEAGQDAGGTVQEAALQSEQPATTSGAAPDVRLRTEATERGLVIRLDELSFPPGSADLARESLPLLTRLAAFLHEHPGQNAVIEGHTDDTGTPTENLHLSLERADAVQEALIEHGVDRRRLILRGYGARYPIADNDTEAGRQKNRRVEVVLLEEGQTVARPRTEPGAER